MDLCQVDPSDQIVSIASRIYAQGMTTTSGGNLSILDDNGDMWITPAGIDKGGLGRHDIVCVKRDQTVEGKHAPSSEWRFHQAIYEKRPAIRALVHAHPPGLVSFSVARRVPETRITPQLYSDCGRVGSARYAMTGTAELARSISDAFGDGLDAVIMENHGAVAGGNDLLEAFHRFESLELCARTLIAAGRLGTVQILRSDQLSLARAATKHLPEMSPESASSLERDRRTEICTMVHRAYDHHLMTSTTGALSALVEKDSFLVTPCDKDLRHLSVGDLVLVRGGRAEEGKCPSCVVYLHRTIYRNHPKVGAIITAQPPFITAHCVTGTRIDTAKMSESYVILQEIPLVPFELQYTDENSVSATLSERTKALLLENVGFLAVGGTVVEAFDRLEVAEFTAKALSDLPFVGEAVSLDARDLGALDKRFF